MAETVYKHGRSYGSSSRDYRDGQMAANLEEEFSTSIGVNIEERAKSLLTGLIPAEWMLPPRVLAGPPPVLSDPMSSGVKKERREKKKKTHACCFHT